ncbi:MAG TPA: M48 family metallopeptidase [Thermoanaerobaculia bacterium]|nr:M48 family metallopeptidase [Thermoanaerobaculia bacterium]
MSQHSLASRAVAAVALMIGFYLLALTIVGALLFIPYAEWRWADRIHVKIALVCIVSAAVILWSILPRMDRFKAPGPRLEPGDHPELFEVLRGVARDTAQEMPSEVYLINEVNAWVSQRGGIMGFGGRRVMGLGLPLMQTTTVSQFRAILAHEFGHYHGGDTKLGPWIYKTRVAIGRTLQGLNNEGFIHKPFEWYGNFFMRVTQAISRAQELAADRLAAQVAGAQAMIDALVAVERSAMAYDAFFQNELIPVVSNGYKPPIAAGFSRFLAAENIASSLTSAVDESLREGQADVYDSHPPLRERVEALKALVADAPATHEPFASSLLRQLSRVEEALLRSMLTDSSMELRDVQWEETGTSVYLPVWRKSAEEHVDALRDVTAEELPTLVAPDSTFWQRLKLGAVPSEERGYALTGILGSALSTRLHDTGWMCDAAPGKAVAFSRDGRTIEPFTAVSRLNSRELTAETWTEECRAAGIDRLTLA